MWGERRRGSDWSLSVFSLGIFRPFLGLFHGFLSSMMSIFVRLLLWWKRWSIYLRGKINNQHKELIMLPSVTDCRLGPRFSLKSVFFLSNTEDLKIEVLFLARTRRWISTAGIRQKIKKYLTKIWNFDRKSSQ